MENTASNNSTNVRFSAIDRAARLFPQIGAQVLSHLFLTPQRKTARVPGAGTEITSIRVQGTDIIVRAQGHGPLVALVHGWQGHSGQFHQIRGALLEEGFTVVTWDMPAHGESRGRTTNIRAFVESILEVGKQLGPLHAIVGHSLGATATALALSKGLQTQGAALIAPMLSFDFALDVFSDVLSLSPTSREIAARATERKVGYQRDDVNLLRLNRPDVPLFLAHDKDDVRIPVHASERLAAHWGDVNPVFTEGLGHRRILEDEDFVQNLAGFVQGLPRSERSDVEFAFQAMPRLKF